MTTTPPDAPAENSGGPRPSRDEIRDLGRLRRSVHDRKVAGVAGGLARHLDIDPVILRVAFVVLTFFGGAGLIVYGACWLLVPEEGSESAPVQLDDKSRTVALIAIGVLAALALVGDSWGAYWFPWPLAIIGLVAFVWLSRNGRGRGGTAGAPAGTPTHGTPYGAASPTAPATGTADTGDTEAAEAATDPTADPAVAAGGQYDPQARAHVGQHGYASPYDPDGRQYSGYDGGYPAPYAAPAPRDPRKRGPKLFWFTLALILFSEGVLGIIDLAGVPIHDSAYAAVAVGVIGTMLVVGSVIGRAGGLIALGLIASLGLTAATAADRWDGEQKVYEPRTSAEVADTYYLEAGELIVDLSEVSDLDGLDGRTIEVRGEVGGISVLVPEDVDVDVTADVDGPGGYDLFGAQGGGIDWTKTASHDGGPDVPSLEIDASLSVGAIDVRTAA
ncbi:PspC domain-containing protein [Nocardioides sp.]|uniref:PspC domain-containing protein n=1 Tax=Nocardioides sp. TaxID=35761 RepID=UPI002ED4ECED